MKFEVNDKVIVSSSSEPAKVGHIIMYEEMPGGQEVPVVDIEGIDMLCFGHVVPYSKEMEKRLSSLDPRQQYELLTAIKDWEGGKQFIIMRGIPGSGKSTKAKNLAGNQGQVFSADDYHVIMGGGEYMWMPKNVKNAHIWNQNRALAAFKADIPIIVIDNTNTTIREMRAFLPHIREAMQRGYKVSIEEPDTSWAFDIEECFKKGTHNVPKEVLQEMFNRYVMNVDVEHILF
jgi:predicted ABC-type ATPase